MKQNKLASTLRFALALIVLGGISAGVSLRANDEGCGGCGGCGKGSTNGPSGSTNAPTKGN